MKRLLFLSLVVAGCNGSRGQAADPLARAFDASYAAFIASAGAHKAGCEVEISAKGDAGRKTDSFETTVEVDERGHYRVTRGDGRVTLRVGSLAWEGEGDKLARIEAGARPDLTRDSAVAAWRPLLAPFRDRITLTKGAGKKLGDRDVEIYALSVEPGGGADGGPAISSGSGSLEIDAATGFPVGFSFEGEWEAPAPDAGRGRVRFKAEKLVCGVAGLGSVEELVAPERVGPPETATPAPATPSPLPVATKKKGK